MEQVDQLLRGPRPCPLDVFLEGMDQARELTDPDAPRRALEGMEASPQLVQSLALFRRPAKAQHERLDPLEQLGAVGEEGLADLLVQRDSRR